LRRQGEALPFWTKDEAQAIQSIKVGQHGVELKLHDGLRAAEMLGKQLGTLTDDTEEARALSTKAAAEEVLTSIADIFRKTRVARRGEIIEVEAPAPGHCRRMSDEILLPDDPEYHLKYDTNGMSKEDHAKLIVTPAKVPVTLNLNINRMFKQLYTEYPKVKGRPADEYEAEMEQLLIAKMRDEIPAEQLKSLLYKWEFWARDNQIPPTGVDVLAPARWPWFRQDPDRGRVD
jgi:hypothetical protein